MRKKLSVLLAGLFCLFLLVMGMGALASNPQGVSVTANVPPTLTLGMPATAVNWGGSNLAPGTQYDQTITATVSSNKDWSLMVYKGGDLSNGTDTIPSSNLLYTSSSSDPKVTATRTDRAFIANPGEYCVQGTRGGSISSSIQYNITVPWDVTPGTYTVAGGHTYTATQP